jgi:CMP-N,N'-diacetyllegionaminic acid synthase
MIYCFDLDGTLCTKRQLDYQNAEPFVDRILHVNKLYDDGHTIIIETARGSGITKGTDWNIITEEQLGRWGLNYHQLRIGVKINADIYIDDKGKNSEDYFKKGDY